VSAPRAFQPRRDLSASVNMPLTSVRHALDRVESRPAAPATTRHSARTRLPPGKSSLRRIGGVTMNRYGRLTSARRSTFRSTREPLISQGTLPQVPITGLPSTGFPGENAKFWAVALPWVTRTTRVSHLLPASNGLIRLCFLRWEDERPTHPTQLAYAERGNPDKVCHRQ
jgi:hypothetical protein